MRALMRTLSSSFSGLSERWLRFRHCMTMTSMLSIFAIQLHNLKTTAASLLHRHIPKYYFLAETLIV
jgi:hypothetical protein